MFLCVLKESKVFLLVKFSPFFVFCKIPVQNRTRLRQSGYGEISKSQIVTSSFHQSTGSEIDTRLFLFLCKGAHNARWGKASCLHACVAKATKTNLFSKANFHKFSVESGRAGPTPKVKTFRPCGASSFYAFLRQVTRFWDRSRVSLTGRAFLGQATL